MYIYERRSLVMVNSGWSSLGRSTHKSPQSEMAMRGGGGAEDVPRLTGARRYWDPFNEIEEEWRL